MKRAKLSEMERFLKSKMTKKAEALYKKLKKAGSNGLETDKQDGKAVSELMARMKIIMFVSPLAPEKIYLVEHDPLKKGPYEAIETAG